MLEDFLKRVRSAEPVEFQETLEVISLYYQYTPACFTNGVGEDVLVNECGTNEGSCRVFTFAALHSLTELQTLSLFGEHYRTVVANPAGNDHLNIRNFMKYGWSGISFQGEALRSRG